VYHPTPTAAAEYRHVDHSPRHTTTPQLYTLSLHDALPIWSSAASLQNDIDNAPVDTPADFVRLRELERDADGRAGAGNLFFLAGDRKSTRLNSSHVKISYAVFCLKKKETP